MTHAVRFDVNVVAPVPIKFLSVAPVLVTAFGYRVFIVPTFEKMHILASSHDFTSTYIEPISDIETSTTPGAKFLYT
jgi:hypothetical protein